MNREQAEELLAAYALDALPEGEAADLKAYLRADAEMAVRARELRAVASALALEPESVTPPAALRSRIVAAVSEKEANAEEPVALAERRGERDRWRGPAIAFGALAAALAIVAAGLLAWNVSLRNEKASQTVTAVAPLQQDTGATAGFAVLFEDGQMSVVGDAFPLLDASQTYQLWAISESGEASSLGLMPPIDGVPRTKVEFDSDDAVQIAVTVEPAGGSDQPTTEPLYTARV